MDRFQNGGSSKVSGGSEGGQGVQGLHIEIQKKVYFMKKGQILGGKGVKKWLGPPLRKILQTNLKAPNERVLDPPLLKVTSEYG